MKFPLTMPFIKNLSVHKRPVGIDPQGQIICEANPAETPYIIYDSTRDAPVGFGIKVAGKKTFIIRRKVDGKSMTAKVGDVADFMSDGKSPLTRARESAAGLATEMRGTGRNPNVDTRKQRANEITLRQAFTAYKRHLSTRTVKSASDSTLKAHEIDVRKFDKYGWLDKKVIDFFLEDILEKFVEEVKNHPSAKERAFRHAITCVSWSIEQEKLAAHTQRRQPLLTTNPFAVLVLNRMFRTPAQLEALRQENQVRNPLQPSTTLGPFLEVAWGKRNYNQNETAVDYLLLQLLLGCRNVEHAGTQWGELLTPELRLKTSHVMLDCPEYGPYVFFYRTKNELNHRLPLGPMAVELLRRRQNLCAEAVVYGEATALHRKFVFPARSKLCKTGHYSDSTYILNVIREDAEILRLTNYDLRRSFGTMMVTLNVPENIQARFFNHKRPIVTDLYTKAEWALLRDWIAKIERSILATAPNIYNSLSPADWPALAAPEPFVSKRIVRLGRPPKERVQQPFATAA
jgi:integrase